jgi:hypothetical protein
MRPILNHLRVRMRMSRSIWQWSRPSDWAQKEKPPLPFSEKRRLDRATNPPHQDEPGIIYLHVSAGRRRSLNDPVAVMDRSCTGNSLHCGAPLEHVWFRRNGIGRSERMRISKSCPSCRLQIGVGFPSECSKDRRGRK